MVESESKISYKEMVDNYQHITKYLTVIARQNEDMFAENADSKEFSEIDPLCEKLVAKFEKAAQIDPDGMSINIPYPDLSATCNNPEIMNILQELLNKQAIIKDCKQQWINMDRKFSDIAKDGPRNMAEARLLDVAVNNLSPHEFSQAVAKDLSPKAMEELVETSRVTRMVEAILTADHQMRVACELETRKRSMHMEKTTLIKQERNGVEFYTQAYRSKDG